jgi:hypothetical protein
MPGVPGPSHFGAPGNHEPQPDHSGIPEGSRRLTGDSEAIRTSDCFIPENADVSPKLIGELLINRKASTRRAPGTKASGGSRGLQAPESSPATRSALAAGPSIMRRSPEKVSSFIPGQTPSACPSQNPPSQDENHPQTVPTQKPTCRYESGVGKRIGGLASIQSHSRRKAR